MALSIGLVAALIPAPSSFALPPDGVALDPTAAGPAATDIDWLEASGGFDEWADDDAPLPSDPLEPMNRGFFWLNMRLDDFFFRPIAIGYAAVVPLGARKAVHRFFSNTRLPQRFANNLFQGKLEYAGLEVGRFVVNTTVGVAGFFDPADAWLGWPPHDEDFGQTLGFYGVPQGPYLVLPIFGPASVRDTSGALADVALDPLTFLFGGVVALAVRSAAEFAQLANYRSLDLELFHDVDRFAFDPYVSVQDFYLQKRERAVAE